MDNLPQKKEIRVEISNKDIQNFDERHYMSENLEDRKFSKRVPREFIFNWWIVNKLKDAGIPMTGSVIDYVSSGTLERFNDIKNDSVVFIWVDE